MTFAKKPVFFLLALFVLPMTCFGQYQFQVEPFFNYFSDAGRYEIGGNYILPMAHIAGDNRVMNGGYFNGDTTLTRAATGSGIGGFIGIAVPIKATGHISCWAVHLELQANQFSWTDINKYYEFNQYGTGSNVTPTLSASTMQIAFPIGLEWKIGCDAIESKRLKFGTALGAGVIPNYDITSLGNVSGVSSVSNFGFAPYVKAEGAFFVGMCIKLRVMYTMGDLKLFETQNAITNLTDGPFRITSNSNLVVSLILMPFSGGWHETAWWNTYDTYNNHDRLN